MKILVRLFAHALPFLLAPASQACEGPTAAVSARAPSGEVAALRAVALVGPDGRTAALGTIAPDLGHGRPVVLAFSEVGCPIASKLAPRLETLAAELRARGVTLVTVDATPHDSLAEIAREARELGRTGPVWKDARQELARALEVRTSTEVFLFDGQGGLAYRGAVDDQYSLGAARPAPTRTYLLSAVQAVLAGHAPEVEETEAAGCLLTYLPEEDLAVPVTYARDIAPILQRRCQVCHRPGQVGPFSLTSYEEAKGRSKMIAKVVEEGIMPPWNAHERFDGVFANERRLTPPEKEALRTWIEDGMPRGNPDDEPPLPQWPEGWTIGTPDLVLQPDYDALRKEPLPPEGFLVPREGVVDYQFFTVKTDFPEDRWVQALEVSPGAADVVHHVLIAVQERNGDIDERSYLGVYVPGDTPSVYPDGYAKRLPAGATLVFQLHYTPNGKERRDLSSLALVFAKEEPLFEVVTDAVINQKFTIPAGAANHEVRETLLLREDTGLVALFPHMHLRGKDFQYIAHFPDGTDQELLYSDYDFQWQESYLLPDPMLLPAGTKLECIGHFDNSAANPNNPDPGSPVRWGEQSFEEMFIGYFDRVVPLE